MSTPLYPLSFEPIFEYRIWGGRRLSTTLGFDLPGDDPIGEAWVLSDREGNASVVKNGPLKGKNLRELFAEFKPELLGELADRFPQFPLLLKFLDANDTLSIQVHPSDKHPELMPPGEKGKTEAWVVLDATPESCIFAGLKPGVTPDSLRKAVADHTVTEDVASFIPKAGDNLLLRAGTVHALGGGLVVFEVQQNSDSTFRLYDWGRIDKKTGKPRDLQIEEALACTDFSAGAVEPTPAQPVAFTPNKVERLLGCEYFDVTKIHGEAPFTVGWEGKPRILVGLAGIGEVVYDGNSTDFATGSVVLIPASVGECQFEPAGPVTVLEIEIPK